MKSILKIFSLLIIVIMISPAMTSPAAESKVIIKEMRGLWVATVLNIDYPSKPSTDPEVLKNEAVKILDYAKDTGFNAVFLQVRPSADALYKSDCFPWSRYLTGAQGAAPDSGFDPLAFWVEEAHNRGLQLHAWINPYRITKNPSDASTLDPSNPAVLNPQWTVKYKDGNLYFNPGIPEVRDTIINSVLEIIRNYNVDGIHMDDYFYPGKDFNDEDTYERYGKAYNNIDDWRRANVDSLVNGISSAIKKVSDKVSFGISPFGIWANKSANKSGSDTNGSQSYYDHYADTRKWVKEGLLDYIAPQLYWYIGHPAADYEKLLTWWKDTVRGTGVNLYVGQGAYLSEVSNLSSPWYGVAEIEKQMQLNAKTNEVKGSIFFNYKSLAANPALSAVIKAIYLQRDGIKTLKPVSVSRPSENIKTSFEQFYLNGVSDPAKPLFLNGQEVENRSVSGFYGILVPLQKGGNIFTLSQEGSYSSRAIYRTTEQTIPGKMSAAAIPVSSVFPQLQEYRMPGEKITLSCKAPVGSSVTVKIGNRDYLMTPSNTAAYGPGIYPAVFTVKYTVPSYSGTPRNVDLGKPVYTMSYNGIKKSVTAPARVGVIMKNSPFYAKVIKSVIDTFDAPVSGNGAAFELYQGMTDYITGATGSYIRLSSGQWVRNYNVSTYTSKYQLRPAIRKVKYSEGTKWDSIKFYMSQSVAAEASFNGEILRLDISTASSAPLPVLTKGSMFSSVSVIRNGNAVEYRFRLKDKAAIEGYYVQKTSEGLTLAVKRPLKLKTAGKPLSGITIMLDPGHGGSENGAVGPLGLQFCEKDINLKTALKLKTELEKDGAKVLMTRTTDKTVSLEERLADSRNAKPDMFIAIHANSMEDNVDMTLVSGLSTYYREVLAQPLAQSLYDNEILSLNRVPKGVEKRNFYVIRGTWTPSILIETGFVPNPDEFEWLIGDSSQAALAKSLAEGIVKYYASKTAS